MRRNFLQDNRSEPEDRPCIWMQAGVVARKYCREGFQCVSCRFDRAMRRAAEENQAGRDAGRSPTGARGRIVSWRSKMQALPRSRRPCIHYMKGRIGFRSCNNLYRCGSCEFDQYFDDDYIVHAVMKPVDLLRIRGFRVPQGYYLHPGHTWVRIEEGPAARVGIDDFACRLFGPFERIEAPLVGKELRQGKDAIGVSRADRNMAVFPAPVSGVVTAVNPVLMDEGLNADREIYSEGWVLNLHSSSLRQDLKKLTFDTENRAFLEGEVDRLYRLIEEVAGPLALDGGDLGQEIYGNMPGLGWKRLIRMFLGGR